MTFCHIIFLQCMTFCFFCLSYMDFWFLHSSWFCAIRNTSSLYPHPIFNASLSVFAPQSLCCDFYTKYGLKSNERQLENLSANERGNKNEEWQSYRAQRKDKERITSTSKAGSPGSVKPLIRLWQQKTHRSGKQCSLF